MSRSLLEAAARDDRLQLQKALSREYGALNHDDINQALLRAALNGNSACVDMLLAEGAEMDCDDSDGDTPLMLAAANNHIDVVRLLLSYGCDIDLQSDRDRSSLHMAVWNRCMRIVEFLLDIGCDVNLQERYGDTPVMLAARRGYPDALAAVLARPDCDINLRSYEKETALHYAARNGHSECLELVLARGPDLEALTLWGHTPLLFAAMGGHTKCAEQLLKAGANSNTTDRSQKSTFHYFAKNNAIDNMKYILERGSLPDISDIDGNTPLMDAVLTGNCGAVKLLVRYGADVQVVGKTTIKGKFSFCSPLELALYRGDLVVAGVLEAAGASSRDLHVFCAAFPDVAFDGHVYPWLGDFLGDPPSLQALCRCTIRGQLHHRLQHGAQSLPLPQALKAYVAFSDLSQD